jgi:hypothetical protein
MTSSARQERAAQKQAREPHQATPVFAARPPPLATRINGVSPSASLKCAGNSRVPRHAGCLRPITSGSQNRQFSQRDLVPT